MTKEYKNMRYILVDTSNVFFRARHIAARGTDQWTKVGYAIHVTLSSINKAVKDINGDHVVFCLEGRSWRKDFYLPYKRNRAEARAEMNSAQLEEDQLFYQAYDDLCNFFKEKTACTVLRHPNGEADDMIARWVALHPNDEHIIVSNDSDFHQLISPNVSQFNGITNEWINIHGIFDDKMKPVKDKKTGNQKNIGDPSYILFEKCMRGDPTDNIFSAYPGVRTKGSKNKVGLLEAFADKEKKGYNWNNLMLQRWTDHDGVEHRVIDDFIRNTTLIDLSAQPANLKNDFDKTITELVNQTVPLQIGSHFLKFCGKYDLTRISEQAKIYSDWMKKEYQGELRADEHPC